GRGRRRETGGSRGCAARRAVRGARRPVSRPGRPGTRRGPLHLIHGGDLRRKRSIPGIRGPFGYPVVAAFLELLLELGVRGPVRLVPFPVGLYGAVARLRERLLGFL